MRGAYIFLSFFKIFKIFKVSEMHKISESSKVTRKKIAGAFGALRGWVRANSHLRPVCHDPNVK